MTLYCCRIFRVNSHHNIASHFSKFLITILFLLGLSFTAAQPGISSGNCKENLIGFTLPTYTEGVPVGTDCLDLCVNQTGAHPDGMFWYPGQDCRAYVKCQNWAAEVWLCPQFEGFDSTTGNCVTLDDDPAIKKEQCKKPVPASTLPAEDDNLTTDIPATSSLPSEIPDDLLQTEPTSSSLPEEVTSPDHKHEHIRDFVTIEMDNTTTTTTTTTTSTSTASTRGITTELTTETAPVTFPPEETSASTANSASTSASTSTSTSTSTLANTSERTTILPASDKSSPATRVISSKATTVKKDVLYSVDDNPRHVDEDTAESRTDGAQTSSSERPISDNYVREGAMEKDDKKKVDEYAPYYFPGTLLRIRIPKRKHQ